MGLKDLGFRAEGWEVLRFRVGVFYYIKSRYFILY